MKGSYEGRGPVDKAVLRELLAREDREHLLPPINVFALAGRALDQIIDGAAIEVVLEISAGEVAGEKQPGRKREGAAAYRGRQGGRVFLADRAVKVDNPRLRGLEKGAMAIPGLGGATPALRAWEPDARVALGRSAHAVPPEGDRADGRDGRRHQVLCEPSGE